MRIYIIKKVLLLVPLLLGVTFISFGLIKMVPGDPVYSLVGERAKPEIIENIRNKIGADRGFVRQYFGYVLLLLRGEMGRSYYTNRSVTDDIMVKFPNTLRLAAATMAIALPTGLLLGFISAIRNNSLTDRIISMISVSGLSIPVFWSGLMLMLFFSLKLKLLPPSGAGGLRYLVLPALTLAFPAVAVLARVTRVTVLDIISMPYIRTARAKGLSDRKINTIHIMKNALIPVVTVIGLEFGSYLNGAVLTETIFGWDGIGRFTMDGIIKRDYPVIMGCVITGTIVFVLINTVVDIIYHYADPRVRIDGTGR